MKKTPEYTVEIEAHTGQIFVLSITLSKKEVNALEQLVESKEGNFYIGTFNTLMIDITRYAAFEILEQWHNDGRLSCCSFYCCSDCGDYVPEEEGCCGNGYGDDVYDVDEEDEGY